MSSPDIPTDDPSLLFPDRSRNKSQPLSHSTRIRNRRRRYLEAHPSYLGPSLESADPLLYDRLIRTHQTEAERTSERASKGFAGTLEADLLRSEAKLDEVRGHSTTGHGDTSDQVPPPRPPMTNGTHNASTINNITNGSIPRPNGDTNTLTPLPIPPNEFTTLTRDEAQQYWVETMTARFVAGEDQDFEYGMVDGDEGLDDVRGEERELEEEWFDGEEEEEVGEEVVSEDRRGVERREGGIGRELRGETGVQDF